MYIQLPCIIRYVSFNIDMHGLCFRIWLYVSCTHSRCIGMCCSFMCCIGDRIRCLSGVSDLLFIRVFYWW